MDARSTANRWRDALARVHAAEVAVLACQAAGARDPLVRELRLARFSLASLRSVLAAVPRSPSEC